ncbi:type IV secretion system protein VirB3 [Inquilinus sp. NPDC058860]|uniref:type IV secretion system protein VirB3 n=1 Tax=Inquilinus sp. NPDC058860 TaxID=3346652 RepID=UPI0036B82E40
MDYRRSEDPLFLACTRPALYAGIPIEAVGVSVMLAGLLSPFFFGSLLGFLPLALLFGGICRAITKYDPNAFRVIFCASNTRWRHKTNAFWGGATVSPLRQWRSYSHKDWIDG